MITIEQLLESVDLDFEPRFVTKDDEVITIWEKKPKFVEGGYRDYWIASGEEVQLEKLKLAEFENKPWKECIYEVPRKENKTITIVQDKDEQIVNKKQLNNAIENIITVIEKTGGTLLTIIAEQRDEINKLKKQLHI